MSVRVFLAEDNDDLAALVSRRLEARSWQVVRSRTAADATSRLRGDRFDAVILDYQLPDGNGLDLLGVVREASPATPVLFLTAHGSENVALQALGLGASDYMQKTGTMLEELPIRVEGLLSRGHDIKRASTVVTVPVTTVQHARPEDDSRGLGVDEGRALLQDFVKGDILGAAFFDGAGVPIAALLPDTLDPRALGLSLVQVHAQAVLMGRTAHLSPRGYTFSLDTTDGTIVSTGVAGRALVVVLLKSGTLRANEKLEALVARLK
ncbi:MAG TPA: response regulator [Candidatus Thermoplasmatota archaeon]|nr:response regulator [Candidatus Thermoplasmatota archaeon]